MWSALTKLVSYDKAPFPCTSPQRVVDVNDAAQAQKVSDEIFESCMGLFNDRKWALGAYTDPDAAQGGDLKLFTQDCIGTYHLVKAVLSFQNTSVDRVCEIMHPDTLEARQKFSADLNLFSIVGRPTKDINIQHLGYYAPPPVAARDFTFLVTKKVAEDGSTYIFGCSVDCPQVPKNNSSLLVRGSSMWAWHLLPVGPHVLATYVNVFDPKGWTPRFVIQWLAYSVANELRISRALIQGKDVKAKKIEVAELGLTQEDLEEKQQA